MHTGPGHRKDVASAITEVLRAEQQALAEIAASEREAEELLRKARQTVRAVLRRTQDRLRRLHAGCAGKTRELIDEIERGTDEYAACAVPGDDEQQVLDNAIGAVAAELTTRGGADAD